MITQKTLRKNRNKHKWMFLRSHREVKIIETGFDLKQ